MNKKLNDMLFDIFRLVFKKMNGKRIFQTRMITICCSYRHNHNSTTVYKKNHWM